MEAQIRFANGMLMKFEEDSQVDLFKAIASAQEVFGEEKCGLCGCTNLRFVVRTVGDDEYMEYHCTNPSCFARLGLGQNKKGGGLFPHRKLTPEGKASRELGKYGKHNGWTKYRGEPKKAE